MGLFEEVNFGVVDLWFGVEKFLCCVGVVYMICVRVYCVGVVVGVVVVLVLLFFVVGNVGGYVWCEVVYG